MSSQDSFERKFRHTARGMRRRPAPRNWDRIESHLDRRDRGSAYFGIRPWMIAAIVLILAGYAVVANLPSQSGPDPLAQRAQSVEELDVLTVPPVSRIPDYQPLSDDRADGFLVSRSETRSRLAVSPKYRL
ncbi:hypothetical protein GGR28_000039 [Lewinella aquimaris]|uniref:Uncharacterized protein n=1 Tax=Neolewinella aquimaris TaxID=1835722 RepID=A0A840E5N9_9BACT|nr:hypothetical protein [Neolewinella aquimaris]MBB4077438.1 hypothetical protein [Neolewinella aquimaris]